VLSQSVLALSSISVTPQSPSVPIGATQQLVATGTFSNGTNGNITASATWASSATNVATVSSAGVAAVVDEGQTTIQAAVGSINASTNLTGTPSRFRLTGSLTYARYFFTATVLQNGQVLIVGGIGYGSAFVPTCELYNPTTGTFSVTGNLNIPRFNHTATLLNNGTVLIAGGLVENSGTFTETATAELYNPSTGQFILTGNMGQALSSHTATLLGSGMVLIAGGEGLSGYPATAELYNPSTLTSGSFSNTGNLNTPRESHSATLLNDGTVLIAGGEGYLNGLPLLYSSAEIYSPTSGVFTTATGSMNVASAGHTATLLNTGQVLIAAGSGGTYGDTPLARTEIYNPTNQTFMLSGSLTTARQYLTATLLSNGQVLIAGGEGTTETVGTGELYNPNSGTTAIAGNLNVPRGYHSAVALNNGLVLLAAGNDDSGDPTDSAETYDPNSTQPPPFTLQITPAVVNMIIGGVQQFTAVDNQGIPRTDASWSVSNSSLAAVTTNGDGTGLVTALAAGQVTITATADGVSAQEQVTILSSASFLPGTVLWSAAPIAGFSPLQTIQTAPTSALSPWGLPDLYSVQLSSDGTKSTIQALQADGEQLWQTTLPPMLNNAVPDGFGGLIVTTCASGSPLTVMDLDATGQPVWQVQSAEVSGYGYICYPPQIAVDGNGVAYIAEPTNAGLPSITTAYPNTYISSFQFQPSVVNNTDIDCCVGPPMVNTDGTMYVEYEVRTTDNNVITSDMLYLYSSVDGPYTLLSSTTQNEALLPGPIIPDGNGGVLATWTISPAKGAPPQYPVQVVDVSGGAVGTPYSLPFSPPSVTFGQNPTFVLADTGAVFATDGTNSTNGPQIVSFNPTSGSVNWSYQVATQYTLSLIDAVSGGGLVAKTTDQNGNDTVIRFSSTGTASADPWTGNGVNYFIGSEWTGTTSGQVVAYSAPPVQLSSSDWFQPQDGGQNKAIQMLNVTNFLTTGPNQTTILNVYQKILAGLPSYTSCNNWAQGTGAFQGISGTSFIQTMTQNTLFGHGSFDALHINTSAITGTGGTTGIPAGIITAVNDNSAFFNATTTNSQGQTLTFEVGPRSYTGGTLRAQAFILLHELGHGISIAGFQHDNGVPKAGKANDKMVDQNCRSLIEGIR
jgi:hypothetical protein